MELLKKLEKYEIILGSASPRRKELLNGLGIKFKVINLNNDEDETYPDNLKKEEIPVFLAIKKSNKFSDLINYNTIIITADTIVYLENKVIGKPSNEKEAFEMLKFLSGKKHEVITGVCIKNINKMISFFDISEVYFKNLSDEEISYYIKKYKPLDKAGAYGIQEWIGYIAIEKIIGSFYNVMGLPIKLVYEKLMEF